MSDLDNAINSINASAAKAENTATFLDDMSTFDDQSSVTNPNNGQTVASIPKQVKDRTDELFSDAESDINQAVSEAAQSATDAQDAADSIGRYQGLWPDSGGIADKGDTYQTQVSGTPTGQYFTALQNTTVDPIGDDVNWREVVSSQSIGGLTNYQVDSALDVPTLKAPVGSVVNVTSRLNALFEIVSGGVPNGYDVINAGNGNTARLQVNGTYGFLEYFGGIGGGSDDTGAILSMVEWCNNNGKLPFTGMESQCLSPLVLANGIVGINGRSKITFPEGFVNPETADDRKLFCVWNKNYSKTYNENTADTFNIHGVEFDVQMLDSDQDISAIIGFANTKGVHVFDCKASSADLIDGKSGARTCISLYDANKNMKIFRNELHNENSKAGGGVIWIQGGSGTSLDDPLCTENIQVFQNDIYQTRPITGDEAIACWAAGGVLKDVSVYRNTFYLNGGGQGLTVFNTANTSETNGLIDNISYEYNTIHAYLNGNAIRLGGENLPEGITRISASNNIIYMKTDNDTSSYTIRIDESSGESVKANNNEIHNTGNVQISRGIGGHPSSKDEAIGNKIFGDFASGIRYVTNCFDNEISGSTFAIHNCNNARHNILKDVKTYALYMDDGENYIQKDNEIEMAAGHSYPIYATSSVTGDVEVIDNLVKSVESVRCLRLQNMGDSKARFNTYKGTGLEPNITDMLDQAIGNNYFGVYDDKSPSAGGGLAGLRLCLPIGHMMRNTDPEVVGDRILAGWVLDNSRAWKSVYMATV